MISQDNLYSTAQRGSVTLLPDPEPEELWCPIISADDHVLEPLTMFEGRVPAQLADAVPRSYVSDDGIPGWEIDGERHPLHLGDGAAGRPRSEWNVFSQARYDEFRRGVWDSNARLKDLDLVGVWSTLCFCSAMWGFAGTRLSRLRDRDAGVAAVRAYNAWMLDEWCAADPDRYIPCQVSFLGDPEIAAQDIRRNAESGFRAVSFSENPEALGFGSLYGDHWDPVFAACADTGTIINLHIGSSGQISRPSEDAPAEVSTALVPLNSMMAVVNWIYARVPIRFPELRIVLSEGGVSWVPATIERLRRAYRRLEGSKSWSLSDPDPVDLLRRNFRFTSIEDPAAFSYLDLIGEDLVMVEVDYPHADSTWPDAQAMIRRELEHLAPAQVQKLCYGNASALYRVPEPPAEWVERSVVGIAARDAA